MDGLIAESRSAVFTCSALKKEYRDSLRQGRPAVRFV
jgi:gluconate kinase